MSVAGIETDCMLLDGRECAVGSGLSLLDLARSRGVEIPTLCHDPRLAPDANCWLCVVEVRGRGGAWQLTPSCATAAEPGMEVRTRSPVIAEARRTAIELLMSDHYADCVAPCQDSCPAGVDVPGYLEAIAVGDFELAVARIRVTNPLPSVCGRVCPHTCEAVCRRTLTGEAVAINNLKRLATDVLPALPAPPAPGAATGRRVAIVGAGPAGLAAAWYLRLQGHEVSLYDAMDEPGGMLRYGIPDYRLPRAALDADLAAIASLGVRFLPGQRLGAALTLASLRAEHDAVFLALGAWKGRVLGIPGEDAGGVLGGVAFLSRVNQGQLGSIDVPVAVIGGGNSAVDAARAALRLGAPAVHLLYRRDRASMPAFSHEVDAALEEGVSLSTLVAPLEIQTEAGRAVAVRLQRMALTGVDASGRPRPVPIPGDELMTPAGWVITAVGELPDAEGAGVPGAGGWGNTVDEETLATDRPGVFSGGDFHTGPSTVVQAVAAGRRAAVSIDSYLREGRPSHPPAPVRSRRAALDVVRPEDLPRGSPAPRASMPKRPAAACAKDFGEETLGYGVSQGQVEAGRCLKCGCDAYDACSLRSLADRWGADPTRFAGRVHHYRRERLRPELELDMNKCIRCARCVRICSEVVGAEALDFVHRGFDVRLLFAAPPGTEVRRRCDACAADGALCADTCPTGALVSLLPEQGR